MKYFIIFAFIILGAKVQCQVSEDLKDEVSFEVIEHVPVYKGCDDSMKNDDKRKCMSDKISELISLNFNTDIVYRSGIPSGPVKISVVFKINKDGYIEDIQARSKHKILEVEAIRVIRLIPRMKPGMQLGKPVSVPYALPILFMVDGNDQTVENSSFPMYNGCNEDLGYELLKQCTIERIMDFVKLNIDVEEVGKLFPLENSTQFQANFVIDKRGEIKDIQVKAHKREMAALAIKTLKRLPKLKLPKVGKEKLSDTPFEFLMTLYFD